MPAVNLSRGTWLATTVRTADGFLTRLFGLLWRRRLGPEEALWLVPCRSVHSIGMRFSIDVVFLDRSGLVVAAVERLGPWRISGFHRRAHGALELPLGTIRKSGTQPGDRIEVVSLGAATVDDLVSQPLVGSSAPAPQA